MSEQASLKTPLIPAKMIFTFILVTTLFALWGFANDITNPLVKAFKDIFVISNVQSSFVQSAFYGGYTFAALPAALFIRRFSYKAGILMGLALYATGALLSLPAAAQANFNLFLVALFVLTIGLAFLETTANPYILALGPRETATRRLNLAQAFNPIGSLTGMVVASTFILSNLQVEDFRADIGAYQKDSSAQIDADLSTYLQAEDARRSAFDQPTITSLPYDMALAEGLQAFKTGELEHFEGKSYEEVRAHDLSIVKTPYVVIGFVVVGMFVIFLVAPIAPSVHSGESIPLGKTFVMLFKNKRYLGGVLAQGFYVGAQIMCWTYIIHYATGNLGMSAADAQNHNIVAMLIFCLSRFICTFFLKYLSPGKLLMLLATGAIALSCGVIFLGNLTGLYCLIGISACMSLMFPTIYGIALDGMGDEAKIASAGLIFAIVGGALMPPLQGSIIDMGDASGLINGLPSVSVSFALPLLCFIIVALYGFACRKART